MSLFRIALVGCGQMSRKWIEYALEADDAEIVALVDIQPEAARAQAAKYHLNCGIYTDLTEAIQTSGANLVFDVTVPAVRKQMVTTAVQNGCDVFSEKPMAATTEDALVIEDTVKGSSKQFSIMQNRRYLKQIRSFKQLLDNGTIGRPGFMTAQFFLGPHFGGFREVMESPLILDMAIHTFDQARLIVGADPVSVYCHEFNSPGSWYEGNAAASCIFEFDNGVVFSYNGSWSAEGVPTSWESNWRIIGSKGTAVWDGYNMPYAEIADLSEAQEGLFNKAKRVEADDVWGGKEGHEGCLDEMFSSLREHRPAETSYIDNKKSIAMVFGALESASLGKKITL
jgi:predicted dehydrogenase